MDKFSKDIQKRQNCIIRIGTVDVVGHSFIEIRQYYIDKDENFIPSKKVISFRAELLDEMIAGLNELKQRIGKRM
ncbi:MAG: hypothetical protein JXB48_12845 [Candidatus Latescibacteria bacterium]|nr:hypothetical protein [Candidatus Latescibacterota bacterium]